MRIINLVKTSTVPNGHATRLHQRSGESFRLHVAFPGPPGQGLDDAYDLLVTVSPHPFRPLAANISGVYLFEGIDFNTFYTYLYFNRKSRDWGIADEYLTSYNAFATPERHRRVASTRRNLFGFPSSAITRQQLSSVIRQASGIIGSAVVNTPTGLLPPAL